MRRGCDVLAEYLELAGTEIVNSARAYAYGTDWGLPIDQCVPCDTLPGAVGDEPYTTPEDDGAPWWDPAVPESAGVLGFLGLEVSGFSTGTISRTPVQLVGDGAALGVARRRHREIAYTVMLLTSDDCAVSYGLEWLASALQGSACGSCSGDQACVFACCPEEGSNGDREVRHLYDVGLLEGPTVTHVQEVDDSGFLVTVEFTLVAGKPWIYREPLEPGSEWTMLADGAVLTVDPDQVWQRCIEPTPCLEDPQCPPPPLPPRAPIPIADCYPSGRDTFRQSIISLSPVDQPAWLESVPVLEVVTGRRPLRRLIVNFWTNPQGGECTDITDPCNACTGMQIPYLPARSLLAVDGRVQRAVVDCPQGAVGTASTAPTLYGPRGRSFEWPTFPCSTGLCIEILSLDVTTAPDARARVLMVPRSDAG